MVVLGLRKSLQDQDEQSKTQGVFTEETSRAGGIMWKVGGQICMGKKGLFQQLGFKMETEGF